MLLGVLGSVELTLRDLNIPFEPGSGVGAAVEQYTQGEDKVVNLF
jgi:hypothetical protein